MNAGLRLLLALAVVLITAGGLLDLFHRRSPEVRSLGRLAFVVGASIVCGLILFVILNGGE